MPGIPICKTSSTSWKATAGASSIPPPCAAEDQVFPLERNAAVRSRLTHSLEVQQTGRFIVRTLFRQLGRVPRRSA